MVIELGAAIARDGVCSARRRSVSGHVVGHIAIDAEDLFLRLLSLEVREVRRARLLDALAAAGDIDRALVAGDRERLPGGLGRHVLAEVAVRALAFEHE